MSKIFVLANEDVRKECVKKAQAWANEPNQVLFGQNTEQHDIAVAAVAEYIANEKGFSMFNINSKYPKDEVGEK